jgi:hypothetical protein
MNTPLTISIIGAFSAIIVSTIGAWLTNRNSIILQVRKLKEEHYVAYIEALHNLSSDNNNKHYDKEYVFARDNLFLIASENVIKKMIAYENNGITGTLEAHDKHLTSLVISIRKNLKLKDRNFPTIYFRKSLL